VVLKTRLYDPPVSPQVANFVLFVSRLALKIEAVDANVPGSFVLPKSNESDVERKVRCKLGLPRHNVTRLAAVASVAPGEDVLQRWYQGERRACERKPLSIRVGCGLINRSLTSIFLSPDKVVVPY
jgi:hypothetical protein